MLWNGNHNLGVDRGFVVELRQYLISTLDICDAFAPISVVSFHQKLQGKK